MLEHSWTTERILRLAVLAILVVACLRIVAPFIGALTWAGIIATTVWPAFLWIAGRLGGRPKLAATLFTLALAVILVLPFAVLVVSLGDAVRQVAALLKDLTAVTFPEPPGWLTQIPLLGKLLDDAWRGAMTDVSGLFNAARPAIETATVWTLAQGAHLGLALLEFLFAIIIAGVFLVTADRSADWAQRVVAKVQIEDGPGLIAVVVSTVRSVSIGVAGTAAVQAVLATLGFFVAGVPGVVLLGFLTFFFALVQLPTVLVWLPAVLWLYYQHQEGWALFMLIWGLVAVGVVDNFLRPYLISQGAKLPIAVIFVGVIGGLLAWGMIGLFIGPTLLAVAYSLLRNWVGEVRAA
ncbi:MAG: AI-2E family transporter [Gammaproteobacteria bacterium]